jgi:polar amino acid transport system substrate-binding protein
MLKKIFLTVCLLVSANAVLAAGVLRVGMSADYPPLHFKQDDQFYGIEVDSAMAVGRMLGRRVELVQMPFVQLIPALTAGKVDVLMSGMSVTAERGKQVSFTDSYLRVGQMTIMHKDKVGSFSQPWAVYREGVRVGVEPGTTGEAFAQRELKEAVIKRYRNPDDAFNGLRDDEIDLYVHDAPTSWQLANGKENQDLISLYTPLTEEMLAWAVALDDEILLEELNEALAMMKANGSLQYILNRWIPVTVEVR